MGLNKEGESGTEPFQTAGVITIVELKRQTRLSRGTMREGKVVRIGDCA